MSKQELFDRIRRDSWQQKLSIRSLSRKYGVHRRLVREALTSSMVAPRKMPRRVSPRMEPYKKTVDKWLREDLEAPRKQRHTAKRIGARLEEEFGVTLAYTTVRDFVTVRRRAIAEEAGAPAEAFLTRRNALGADAEVDFGEVWVRLGGREDAVKCHLFAFRLAYSGRAVHRISRSQGQQAFFEGHVHALNRLGGVPAGQVRYDNLTPGGVEGHLQEPVAGGERALDAVPRVLCPCSRGFPGPLGFAGDLDGFLTWSSLRHDTAG
ncbi:hypothetical protein [Streptomyces sp. ITFR-6]|uniref:hypothetical protein n=1 Tax=Streptomyces sp. ITFR-6 TaxID=3075197 RepID=UPI00288BD313|nr:hypothetical protein [Streptomyces sp. ITFR-6]WNI33392.1 hypothetical protein RLT59_34755 [Streptomyces sp. ITFR-6]